MFGEIAVELRLGDAHVACEVPANHDAAQLMDQGRLSRADVGTRPVPELLGARGTVFRVGVWRVARGGLTREAQSLH